MTASRPVISATGSNQNPPCTTSAHSPPTTKNLSANGSRNAPERVVPCLRASHPSNPSVSAITKPSANAGHDGPRSTTTASQTGVSSSRARVSAFAGVASAPGPNDDDDCGGAVRVDMAGSGYDGFEVVRVRAGDAHLRERAGHERVGDVHDAVDLRRLTV